jgi:site-specific DNA recombinase
MSDADDRLKRLYRLIEEGVTDADEVLKDRLNELKADRDRAKAALERAKEHSAPQGHIDPALIERFGRTLCENFRNGSVPFRKAYLQSLIDVIEIDDRQIRIKGRKELLEKAVLASQNGQSECSQTSTKWTSDPQIWGLVFTGATYMQLASHCGLSAHNKSLNLLCLIVTLTPVPLPQGK